MEYLRAIYYPLNKGGFQFPVLTLEQMTALGDEHWVRLLIELGRELCTLIMLMSIGIVAGRNRREAWAYFVVAFGVWDISFYLWLKLFLNWPPGLMTWDLLFLIPVPWVGPVLAPIMVSLTMILAGVIVLRRESKGKPVTARWTDWILMIVGGGIVIISFCWDYENIIERRLAKSFSLAAFLRRPFDRLRRLCRSCATQAVQKKPALDSNKSLWYSIIFVETACIRRPHA